MIFEPADLNDSRIVAQSTYWEDKRDYEFENRAGVYIFVNSAGHVKYVGSAGAGRTHDEVGDALRRGKGAGASLVGALYTNSTRDARTLEDDLIEKYDPPNNLRGGRSQNL